MAAACVHSYELSQNQLPFLPICRLQFFFSASKEFQTLCTSLLPAALAAEGARINSQRFLELLRRGPPSHVARADWERTWAIVATARLEHDRYDQHSFSFDSTFVNTAFRRQLQDAIRVALAAGVAGTPIQETLELLGEYEYDARNGGIIEFYKGPLYHAILEECDQCAGRNVVPCVGWMAAWLDVGAYIDSANDDTMFKHLATSLARPQDLKEVFEFLLEHGADAVRDTWAEGISESAVLVALRRELPDPASRALWQSLWKRVAQASLLAVVKRRKFYLSQLVDASLVAVAVGLEDNIKDVASDLLQKTAFDSEDENIDNLPVALAVENECEQVASGIIPNVQWVRAWLHELSKSQISKRVTHAKALKALAGGVQNGIQPCRLDACVQLLVENGARVGGQWIVAALGSANGSDPEWLAWMASWKTVAVRQLSWACTGGKSAMVARGFFNQRVSRGEAVQEQVSALVAAMLAGVAPDKDLQTSPSHRFRDVVFLKCQHEVLQAAITLKAWLRIQPTPCHFGSSHEDAADVLEFVALSQLPVSDLLEVAALLVSCGASASGKSILHALERQHTCSAQDAIMWEKVWRRALRNRLQELVGKAQRMKSEDCDSDADDCLDEYEQVDLEETFAAMVGHGQQIDDSVFDRIRETFDMPAALNDALQAECARAAGKNQAPDVAKLKALLQCGSAVCADPMWLMSKADESPQQIHMSSLNRCIFLQSMVTLCLI